MIKEREREAMIKHTVKGLAILAAVLLLQPGCATVRIGQEPNESSIVVKDLVKTTKSWGWGALASIPASPAGDHNQTNQHTCRGTTGDAQSSGDKCRRAVERGTHGCHLRGKEVAAQSGRSHR